ncbi:hypothetical protein L3Y34_013733 [Caenorhabditis briggsae]|uniref:Uncharacterized protein n=1 Tax=Caenorhabditis briggsae TaxID=6238 RepID=A0AAE8ZSB7_CAEBR|nr:hypothetical protein L3Y34_013733 [Caenorhabditis briggsae]
MDDTMDDMEMDDLIDLVDKCYKELHTVPLTYEQIYNQEQRERKILKIGKTMHFNAEYLETKIGEAILKFWENTHDRAEKQNLNPHFLKFHDKNLKEQIHQSLEKGLKKGMDLIVRHDVDKLLKQIEKEKKEKDHKNKQKEENVKDSGQGEDEPTH